MKETTKVYDDLLDHVMHLLNDHQAPVELIAGTMIAIAQRLYKTHLSEADYQKIMKIAYETNVKPYDVTTGTLH